MLGINIGSPFEVYWTASCVDVDIEPALLMTLCSYRLCTSTETIKRREMILAPAVVEGRALAKQHAIQNLLLA